MKKIIMTLLILGLILTSCGTESASAPKAESDQQPNSEQASSETTHNNTSEETASTNEATSNSKVDQTSTDENSQKEAKSNSEDKTKIPDIIEGHKVLSYEKTDDAFGIKMDGVYENIEGSLFIDEMDGGYGFSMADKYYDTLESFEISFPDGDAFETFKVTPPGGLISVDKATIIGVMGQDAITKLDNGEPIKVTCNISHYSNSIYYRSEGSATADLEIISFDKKDFESGTDAFQIPASAEAGNITDKALLADLILANFDNVLLNKQEIMERLTFDYFDFTSDGVVDVVCYSADNNGFNDTAFFTVKEGKITLVPCDEGWAKYEQSYDFDGTFIIKDSASGGTGIYEKTRHLLVYNGEKIVSTGAILVENARTSAQGYDTETVGTTTFDVPDDYTSFIHEVEMTGTETSYEKKKYVYDPSNYSFKITELENTNANSTQDKSSENEFSAASDNSSENGYNIETLNEDQKVEQYTVKNVHYIKNDEASFELEGEVTLKGVIELDEMWGEYVFTSQENMLDNPIQVVGYSFIKPEYASFDQGILSQLSKAERAYLEDNESIEVSATISKYSMSMKDGTEGGSGVEIKALKVLTEIDPNENQNSGSKLEGLENETFSIMDKGDFLVDYSKYRCVVVPMKTSQNMEALSANMIPVRFSDGEPKLVFSVFGTLENVRLNYVANMGEEGIWQEVGTVKNALVLIAAELPSDMSYVKVYGRVNKGNNTYENIEFTLDDVRDAEAYEVYTVE